MTDLQKAELMMQTIKGCVVGYFVFTLIGWVL